VLTGIATLNNAKVDMPIDPSVKWFVDYNMEFCDEETEKPVGTLRIPAFLIHDGKRVDARAVLADTLSYVKKELLQLFKENPKMSGLESINGADVTDISFTSATELEFWVKTPLEDAAIEEMSASQVMQEQYWERTQGIVRTAMEACLLELDKYGLQLRWDIKRSVASRLRLMRMAIRRMSASSLRSTGVLRMLCRPLITRSLSVR
jgi:glutamine synthetase